MRISDWSSDVCSSDLGLLHRTRGTVPAAARRSRRHDGQAVHLRPGAAGGQKTADYCGRRDRREPALGPDLGLHEHRDIRSEEHTSELQSLMRISYAVFCLKKKKKTLN